MPFRFAALLLLPLPALAAPTPHVVVIGVARHADKGILARPHAERDAAALFDLLTEKGRLGGEAKARLLLGTPDKKRKSGPATRAAILEALAWLHGSAREDDPVVFAWFGAGGPRCYLASDSTIKGRGKDAVSADKIAAEFDKLKSRRACILLDVDFKAAGVEASLGNQPYREFLGEEDDQGEPRPGRAAFMAASGLSPGLDLEDHGLFAAALLAGLRGGADTEGGEADGAITTTELAAWLDKEMPRLRREKAPDARHVSHVAIRTAFDRYPVAYEPKARAAVEEQAGALAKSGKLSDEMKREGTGLLERMPRREPLRALRKEYREFAAGRRTATELEEARKKLLDSMKVGSGEARSFADKVLAAAFIVQQHHLRELETGHLVANAVRGMHLELGEPLPEELAERTKGAAKSRLRQQRALLADARAALGKRPELDGHKALDLALRRMLSSLDRYSTYIGPEQKARLDMDLTGGYAGVGATVEKDEGTGLVRIMSPARGGPALAAGLQAGDLIEKVIREVDSDGARLRPPEVLATKDMALPDVIRKIKGKPGTRVKLSLRRPGKAEPFEAELERKEIKVESVLGAKRLADHSWDHLLDADSKIGYVRLIHFVPQTAADLKEAVEQLKKQGMKSLVLDLRFNSGGLLDAARDVSDLLIDDELIVSIRPRVGRERRLVGSKEGSLLGFPMVCLINGSSASASEIVSSCLQDHGRARIAGSRSFGKGSVQSHGPFEGGMLRMTTATFWRPSGKNLNKPAKGAKDEDEWGVKPDKGLELALPRSEEDALRKALLDAEIILPPGKERKAFADRQLELAMKHLRK
ncbi:MAG: S41 family peptidase [Gemmataceae bacterium]|nr:S41 family peptidase [Gemmataceae bacterium]